MPQFFYKARDRGGKLITGEMEGLNRTDIAGRIGGMGYIPVLIQATGREINSRPGRAKGISGFRKGNFFWFSGKIQKSKTE